MRDNRFISSHMGGPLSIQNHKHLIHWAVDCVEHGMQKLIETEIDDRALSALQIALKWEAGNASVGDARKAAFRAHDAARECTDKAAQAVYRACGHAVATAHMADHSLHARAYILKALKIYGIEIEIEKTWQIQNAHTDIKELLQ